MECSTRVALIGSAAGVAALLAWRRWRDRAALDAVADATAGARTLCEMSDDIVQTLRRYKPVEVEGVDPALHYMAPHVPKVVWTELGHRVVHIERTSNGSIDGSRWISLRLDGSGFSRAVRMLRRKDVLEESGYSETFADCMTSALRLLMEHMNARVGYTQSDEMVVFIPPTNIVRGERQAHQRNGRVTKLTTLAASLVTARFVLGLSAKCIERGVSIDGLCDVLPHFDCRLSSFESWEEAQALLLWRAYDCSVNGVSDAVYQAKGSGKEVQSLGTREKLAWLCREGLLPLPFHQAHGTVLARVKRLHHGFNPKTCATVQTLRGTIEHVDGPVLELVRAGSLFPVDDALT